MKVLSKKLFGVSVLVWILLASVGMVAAYVVATVTTTTTVTEPISVSEETELPATIYPGESATYKVDITNASGAPTYSMTYTITVSGPTGTSWSATVEGAAYTSGTAVSLAGGVTHDLDITVSLASDAAPGTVDASVVVDRA